MLPPCEATSPHSCPTPLRAAGSLTRSRSVIPPAVIFTNQVQIPRK